MLWAIRFEDTLVHYDYRFQWRDRSGVYQEFAVTQCFPIDQVVEPNLRFQQARKFAIDNSDYPGHEGGWYNWFVTDLHLWLVKRCGRTTRD